jgi:hypothetical protein
VPLRTVIATRYAAPLREGGSLPGIVEADDDGLFVVKFRGAGQGPKALIAEVITGELGRALGLPVPDQVLVEVDPALGKAEPDAEIRELIGASGGTNAGLDYLPGSLPFAPAVGPAPTPELAAAVVWLDALTTNVDRSPHNPNLLIWHGRLYLIDHGASLYIHHTWMNAAEHARQPFGRIASHVLLPFAGSIEEADERLAPEVTRSLLEAITAWVPDDWLGDRAHFPDPDAERRAYVDYLLRRLEEPRAFASETERARRA